MPQKHAVVNLFTRFTPLFRLPFNEFLSDEVRDSLARFALTKKSSNTDPDEFVCVVLMDSNENLLSTGANFAAAELYCVGAAFARVVGLICSSSADELPKLLNHGAPAMRCPSLANGTSGTSSSSSTGVYHSLNRTSGVMLTRLSSTYRMVIIMGSCCWSCCMASPMSGCPDEPATERTTCNKSRGMWRYVALQCTALTSSLVRDENYECRMKRRTQGAARNEGWQSDETRLSELRIRGV